MVRYLIREDVFNKENIGHEKKVEKGPEEISEDVFDLLWNSGDGGLKGLRKDVWNYISDYSNIQIKRVKSKPRESRG